MSAPPSPTTGNTEEDWRIFEILTKDMDMDGEDVDVTTTLRSEIAALQYKRDRLTEEVNEMRGHLRARDQRCVEFQIETDHLREQAARQNAIICSLKKRVHELEERERELHALHSRGEISLQTALRDSRYNEDKAKDLEKKVRSLERDLNDEEQKKEAARVAFHDLVRRLSVALGSDISDGIHLPPDTLVQKASELVQETSRLRNKALNIQDNLATCELDVKTLKEALDRSMADKECLQRQSANQLLELDRLRQEKDSLEMQNRVADREITDLREKLSSATRNLGSTSGAVAQLEATVCQLRDDLKITNEKYERLHDEHRSSLQSISSLLSTHRFVEPHEESIKDCIRDILTENRDKASQIDALRDKLAHETQQLERHVVLFEQANEKVRALEEDRGLLEHRLRKTDAELNACGMSREGLKRDRHVFQSFLGRLGRALNMDEITQDVGTDLHMESLLLRAEQLARLESDKLADKTAVVYQLQRRMRTLREQLQRKDLHLDLLRRKLSLAEDSTKAKIMLQGERDEANARVKKLNKQVDRLHMQLSDAKDQIRDLNAQLAEAADYKITALERARKIDDLQKRLIESEALRTRYNRKVTLLKDQVRATGESIEQERSIGEHSMHLLREELARLKHTLEEVSRREMQLQNLKCNIAKILGVLLPVPDYELVSRLQKLVDAHHEFTVVSRRYDDPVLRLTSKSPTLGSLYARTPDKIRYDDPGYIDGADFDDIDDELFKRPPI